MSAGESYQQIETLKRIRIPVLSRIPLIGDAFFNQDIMTYLVFVLVILASVFYRKTSSGLAFSSIGENPQSADAAGICIWTSVGCDCGKRCIGRYRRCSFGTGTAW